MATTARLLQLLSLLQTRRTWSGQELMDRLEVSERTLRRDIERLRDLGYPVRATPGPAGGYQLEPVADIPPLLLDEEEAIAIAVGLRTAAGGSITGIEETSVRALAKLEQVLPPRVRRQVNTLQTAVAPMIRSWATVDVDVLATLAQACRDCERIRFEYQTRTGDTAERHVEPHRLVTLHRRWYLVAYDRDRDDWRTFRLDRIRDPRPTRLRFNPRQIPGGDPVEYVLESMGAIPMRYHVTAVLHAPYEEIAPKVRPREGEVEPRDGHSCLFRTRGDSLEWLAFHLIWFDVDFEILEPPELVGYVEGLATRLARAVSTAR
ncbi:MAG: YafY family protein [Actinomycetes bacterium]|jgi:predicted DNA-binding transcriptional regulator YafY|nr:YafY family transcriptional regulator [Acidimicrobiia bacterium]